MARKYFKKYGKRNGRKYRRVAKRKSNRRRLVPMPSQYNYAMGPGTQQFGGTRAPGLYKPVTAISAPKRGRVPTGDIQRLGENTSMSACYVGKRTRGMRSMFSATGVGGMKKQYANAVGTLNGTTGTQSVNNWSSLTRTELITMKTSLEGDLPAEFKPGTNDMKMFIGSITQRLHLKNQTNHVACVVLYDIITRRSSNNTNNDTPGEAWALGTTDQGLSSYITYPGNSPFESVDFNKYFKVVKSVRLYLEPGEQHEHVFVRRINRTYNSTLFDRAAGTAGECIAGLTGWIMAAYYGSIGHSSTDAASTVSYMPVRIDHIHHQIYNFQCAGVLQKRTVLGGANNITTTAPANWDYMADAGDIEGDLIVS